MSARPNYVANSPDNCEPSSKFPHEVPWAKCLPGGFACRGRRVKASHLLFATYRSHLPSDGQQHPPGKPRVMARSHAARRYG